MDGPGDRKLDVTRAEGGRVNRKIKVGTCSWTDPTLIASGWYPEKIAKKADERLRFYAAQFPVVENDAAYYALPDPKQAQLWTERTPDGFTMDFKAFGSITTQSINPKP